MPRKQNGHIPVREERSKRQERAERILDAAAELITRWGYHKTTIDDIAKKAGVAKGTIYLHWKTREDLFQALMDREEVLLTADIKQRMAGDPEAGTLHGMMRNAMLATMKRPLMKAVFLSDTEVLGQWAQREAASDVYTQRMAEYLKYFELLRGRGLVRTDISAQKQAYMLSSIAMGFLVTGPLMPEELTLSDEEAAEMIAEIVRRTFEPHGPTSSQESAEISQAFTHYLDRLADIIKEQNQQEAEP
ncbi:MAG: TetR/AcrR family transcriptional regulator [Chloroflexota bacterium]|nr:TetR/AcrR family transcriptional regulator [Chloroflexota bacterium]